MKLFLILILFATHALAHEKELKTKADAFAFAEYKSKNNYQWPFPLLSIGHNMQSFQNYGGSAYWHDGLDIRSTPNQAIYASVGGKVVNVENYQRGNPLYWEVAILDNEGFVWKYHHVDRKSIPTEIFTAFQNKSEIASGTFIGNVVEWPVTSFGEVFNHLHLLVVAKDGKYINPLLLLAPLNDRDAPQISKIGITKNHRPIDGNAVSGPHGLYVEASDLILHHKYILPPHKISYKLNGQEEKLVWEFVHLPSATNDTDFINDFYLKGTCGNYSCRKFFINLNFETKSPRGTFNLNPGTQEIEVVVEDIVGNRASETFRWEVL